MTFIASGGIVANFTPQVAVPPPDWIIPSSFNFSTSGYWDGDSPSAEVLTHAQNGQTSVSPGDIIQFAAGNRRDFRMRNIHGALGNRVIIRSDPAGKTTMARTSGFGGSFVFWIQNVDHLNLDGGFTSDEFHGIKITATDPGDAPSAFIQFLGIVTDFTVRYVEIDGAWPAIATAGIGFQITDNSVLESTQEWRDHIIFEHCWAHHTQKSGFYLGNNYSDDGGVTARNAPKTRNLIIRYCKATDTGRRGLSIKMGQEGLGNRMHHNYVKNTGLGGESTDGFLSGATFFEGMGEFDHNWIQNTGWHGLTATALHTPDSVIFPPLLLHDNIIIATGLQTASASHGLSAGAPTGGFAFPARVDAYNNTVIDAKDYGISMNSELYGDTIIQNNILAGGGAGAILDLSKGTSIITPNETGSVAAQIFGSNFALTASSPARNAAVSGLVSVDDSAGMRAWVAAGADPETSIEAFVVQDETRPLGIEVCRGALEFDE